MFHRFKHILPGALQKSSTRRSVASTMMAQEVEKILKTLLSEASDSIHVVSVKNGVIKIRCDHSAFSSEIRLREKELLASIHRSFHEKDAHSIRLC